MGKFFQRTIYGLLLFLISCNGYSAQNKKAEEKLPEGVEAFTEKQFPEEIEHEDYSHPYRWNKKNLEQIQFKEIWGYVLDSRFNEYNPETPLTDIGYFAAEINSYGKLTGIPKRNRLSDFKGRVHLVAICESRSLTHFVLDPEYKLRDRLVKDLIEAAADFDGLQIDFELVPGKDSENYLDFLKMLKKRLGKKTLTVCVPARLKDIADDTYSYKKIAAIADKIFVMAYDEHWATSEPGSIASMDWCEKIMNYVKTVLPCEKVIMGVPFYGRVWVDPNLQKAYAFNGMNRIMHENNVKKLYRKNGVPYFETEVNVKVTGYYDDATSLSQRCKMYKDAGFESIGFWRMGHEDAAFWENIELENQD